MLKENTVELKTIILTDEKWTRAIWAVAFSQVAGLTGT